MYKPSNGSVLVAIVSKQSWIPLVRQPDFHSKVFWKFPGGKIEDGETPEEAGVREVSEEIALDISRFKLERLAQEAKESRGLAYVQYLLGVVVPDDLLDRYIGDYVTSYDDERVRHESTCFKLSQLVDMPDFMSSHRDLILKSQGHKLAEAQ